MSFKKYRVIDLSIFLCLYALIEFLIIKGATTWFNEPYVVSLMLPLLLIVMIRWDKYSIIHAVLYGILFVLFNKGSWQQYLIYIVGNLGFMLELLFIKYVGKEKIRNSVLLSIVYTLIGFFLIELFRSLTGMILFKQGLGLLVQFLLEDMLSFAFSLVIILIVRKTNGLFVDQLTYLKSLKSDNNSSI